MVIKTGPENIQEALHTAVKVLNNGGIVAFATETFYGLGVKFDNESALKRLYGLKKRPRDKAMPLIIGSAAQLPTLTQTTSETAKILIEKFWPGALTLIFTAKQGFSEYIAADGKIAVRVPGESFAFRLAQTAGFPITATSANISGRPPADSPEMVLGYFGDMLDLVIDSGKTRGGLPSTILDVSSDEIRVLRPGAIEVKI
ncbi:MAG: threonylcarbamoyl-AMP synthase [Nitrospirae bacterium]|nr:MAG: threonylcarbamoyl-AMP synthase [Nitrospirota bacterium]